MFAEKLDSAVHKTVMSVSNNSTTTSKPNAAVHQIGFSVSKNSVSKNFEGLKDLENTKEKPIPIKVRDNTSELTKITAELKKIPAPTSLTKIKSKRKGIDEKSSEVTSVKKKEVEKEEYLENVSDTEFSEDDLSSIINEFILVDEIGEVNLENFEDMIGRITQRSRENEKVLGK